MSPSVLALPVAPAARPAAAPSVLIADADAARGRALAARCVGAGAQAMVAVDALQAVTFARRTLPQFIVLHARLPGGNGLGALQRIRSIPALSWVPIVLVGTAELPARMVAEATRGMGAELTLLDDVAPEAVLDVLAHAMAGTPALRVVA